jgi:hypothetical protein
MPQLHSGRSSNIKHLSHHPKAESSNSATGTSIKKMEMSNFCKKFVNVLPRFSLFKLVVPKLHIGRSSNIKHPSHHPKAESSNSATGTSIKKMEMSNFCKKCC